MLRRSLPPLSPRPDTVHMASDVAPDSYLDAPRSPSVPASRDSERSRLLGQFNRAVRQPAPFGGLSTLPLLLDKLADAERHGEQTLWIPDTNARLSPAVLMREYFPDPAIHVAASQYGEDAFRRGWLHLDRVLDHAEFDRLVSGSQTWAKADRTFHDIVSEYGSASITFGDPDPQRPKTMGYASADREAPFVAFHLGTAATAKDSRPDDPEESAAVLLAVRIHEDFFKGWQFTPQGDRAADESPTS